MLDVSACARPWYSRGVHVCKRVFIFLLMQCELCVRVWLIKELVSDGSHPVTSTPEESFTHTDLWLNLAALFEQDDIEY